MGLFRRRSEGDSQEKHVRRTISALHDTNPEVRIRAANTLGQLGDARAVSPLIPLLSADWVPERSAGVEALLAIGNPSIGPLMDALTLGEESSSATTSAVEAQLREKYPDLDGDALQLLVSHAGVNAAGRDATPPEGSLRDTQRAYWKALAILASLADEDTLPVVANRLATQGSWSVLVGDKMVAKDCLLATLSDEALPLAARQRAGAALAELGGAVLEHMTAALSDKIMEAFRVLNDAIVEALGVALESPLLRFHDQILAALRDAGSIEAQRLVREHGG